MALLYGVWGYEGMGVIQRNDEYSAWQAVSAVSLSYPSARHMRDNGYHTTVPGPHIDPTSPLVSWQTCESMAATP